jgi:lytic murein transglycosylase
VKTDGGGRARSPLFRLIPNLLWVAPAIALSCASNAPRPREPEAAWVSAPDPDHRLESREIPAPVKPVPLESCGNTGEGFDGWIGAFRKHAVDRGISARTVALALDGVTYDPNVVTLDRSQSSFKLGFAEFAAQRITRARLARGAELLRENAGLFARIEAAFGVPAEILVAIWGLETDYGQNTGAHYALRALATLAYDCRRSARFRDELLAALRIVDRGDLGPADMVGAWAGELGQTQFLPSSYERFAVDFDGDGRANLIASSADALASTAAYLRGHGFREGEPYGEGTPNDTALAAWNASEVYRKTIVLFATKLAKTRRARAR